MCAMPVDVRKNTIAPVVLELQAVVGGQTWVELLGPLGTSIHPQLLVHVSSLQVLGSNTTLALLCHFSPVCNIYRNVFLSEAEYFPDQQFPEEQNLRSSF